MNKSATPSILPLVRGAVIAALYAALTLLLAPISYSWLQVRFSEALTLLPILLPEAVPGVAVGCLIANLLSPMGVSVPDVILGTAATLLAAMATRRLRGRFWLAASMPVIANGLIVGALVHYVYTPEIALPLCMGSVAAGEAVACLIAGPLLLRALRRLPAGILG